MRKVRFIIEEFFRSFRKSLFKNILLMFMFSISLVMTVIMGSYYFDLGDRYAVLTQQDDDRIWCNLDIMMENDSEIWNSFSTVTGCRNMIDYYETLRSSEDCSIISIDTYQTIFMREEDVKNFFGDRSYSEFLESYQQEPVWAQFGNDGDTTSILYIKSVRADLGAYQLFGLRTQEGEGFTEHNMTVKNISDPIPILLGSDYKGIIEVGEVLEIYFWDFVYQCKVVGILEQGATIPSYNCGIMISNSCQLDSRILFPYGIKVQDTTDKVEEIIKYADLDYLSLQNGIAMVKDGKINKQVAVFREMGEKFGIPAVRLEGASLGVDLLRKESSASVRIMLVLTIILLCFTFYGICITFYDKIQSNSRTYGIYLMNGCSISMIMASCLIEIALILLPSVLVCRYIFITKNIGYCYKDVIMQVACGFAGLVFVAGAALIILLMRGVDTEHLVRQKD